MSLEQLYDLILDYLIKHYGVVLHNYIANPSIAACRMTLYFHEDTYRLCWDETPNSPYTWEHAIYIDKYEH